MLYFWCLVPVLYWVSGGYIVVRHFVTRRSGLRTRLQMMCPDTSIFVSAQDQGTRMVRPPYIGP
ncbi:DUF1378 family protein [Yoonia sp. 2307UL14-13]|uniref:DUF1378 family protein n=1 Tax=Yoonia sp. 2307UL14-13 TaxID=3126506 RepID=UPI00404034CB